MSWTASAHDSFSRPCAYWTRCADVTLTKMGQQDWASLKWGKQFFFVLLRVCLCSWPGFSPIFFHLYSLCTYLMVEICIAAVYRLAPIAFALRCSSFSNFKRNKKRKGKKIVGTRVERTVDCNKSNIELERVDRSLRVFRSSFFFPSPLKAGHNRHAIISARTTSLLRRESRAHAASQKRLQYILASGSQCGRERK